METKSKLENKKILRRIKPEKATKTKHRGWFSVLTGEKLSYILYRVVNHAENSKRNRKPIWRTENRPLRSFRSLCSCCNLYGQEAIL